VGKDGKIEGFDIGLIEWILPKLKSELKIDGNIEYKITKLPWSDLLPSLAKHEIDLVISAMTSTKEREDSNPGIKFTEGYYQSHQIFISLRDGRNFVQRLEDLRQLRGKKVGVFAGTTNEQAAHFLTKKYGFTVDNMYKSQDDLISGLQNNKIDFALMDDVLAKICHGMKFHQVGPKLDILLKDFYWERLGRANEKYAIAVVDEPLTLPNLLTLINAMLKSTEGQEKLQELAEKWIK
jgi:ABC-type amino acid transport substrate-binding protein